MLIGVQFSFDGKNYQSVGSSKHSHHGAGLANYRNQALTTGCVSGGCAVKTELFNTETLTWSDGPDYPFGR